jgi:hypothetical protein
MMLRGLLILVVGAGALAGAIWLTVEQWHFLEIAQRAPGEVVALNAGGSHPQIRFNGPDGQAISYPEGGLIWGYREGMQVEVLFDPAHPRRTAVVNDIGAIWGMSMLFGGIGAGLLLGGLWTLWLARRKND